MSSKRKKWLTFTLRWGIAVVGIWWVLSQITWRDRVTTLNALNRPVSERLADTPPLNATQFNLLDGRTVSRSELISLPDQKSVTLADKSTADLLGLDLSPNLKSVNRLLIATNSTAPGQWITPALVPGYTLKVPHPLVEAGIGRMIHDAASGHKPWLLLFAVVIFPITYIVTSFRWHQLLKALNIHLTIAHTFALNMVGGIYNTFMLGSTGGDVIKAYYASKQTGHRTRAVLSVFVDRFVGLIALVIMGGAMAAYQYFNSPPGDPAAHACGKIALISALIVFGTAAGLAVFYNPALRRISGLAWFIQRFGKRKQVKSGVETMELYRKHATMVFISLIATFPVHITVVLSAMFAGWAFGLTISPLYYFVAVPVIVLVGSIPISPQGAGVMEYFAILLLSRQGATVSQAFALTMSIRMVQILWNLTGGIFVFRGGYHQPTEAEQHDLDQPDDPSPPPRTSKQDADQPPFPPTGVTFVLKNVDRILMRVESLEGAVGYYRDVIGLKLVKQDQRLASFRLLDGKTELVLHVDADLPDHAMYYFVDSVKDLYRRREQLKLKFAAPPSPISRGFRATVKDPFGNVLLLLDRAAASEGAAESDLIEDTKIAAGLFAGIEQRTHVEKDILIKTYEQTARTADDLPYTPHFETLYRDYAAAHGEPKPTRGEVWRHLLNLRKGGKLPKLGPARSMPPEISPEDRDRLKQMLGKDIGKRDRLPYTDRFDKLVDEFNGTQTRKISPHLVWRLVATLAK